MNREGGLGAAYLGDSCCQFMVWALLIQTVAVRIVSPRELILPLEKGAQGYHSYEVFYQHSGSTFLGKSRANA